MSGAAVYLMGLALVVLSSVAVRARLLHRAADAWAADLRALQAALLPELPERIGALAIDAAYRPSDGPAAGGDFYDAFALDGRRTCILIGDVAGHGRDALPLTAAVRFTLRAHLEGGASPCEALSLAASSLDAQLAGRLVTATVAVFDSHTYELAYACAGHPAPVVAGESGPRAVAVSPPLGARVPTGLRSTTISLQHGDRVCFHTDGLLDARVAVGRFGRERLAAALVRSRGAEELLEQVRARTTSQPDDMTALVIRVGDLRLRLAPARNGDESVEDMRLEARVARFLRRSPALTGTSA